MGYIQAQARAGKPCPYVSRNAGGGLSRHEFCAAFAPTRFEIDCGWRGCGCCCARGGIIWQELPGGQYVSCQYFPGEYADCERNWDNWDNIEQADFGPHFGYIA